jgi:ADP-ribose pyrophosphatase
LRLVDTKKTRLSRFATLVERVVEINGREESFHALEQSDYANVLAVTTDDRVVIVRQYRPAMDAFTLELPGGLLDPGEDAGTALRRELHEETGMKPGRLQQVGRLKVDTGRLINTAWGYVALDCVADPNWKPEHETEMKLVPREEYYQMILRGEFNHGFHIAIVGLAIMHGLVPSPQLGTLR